jgi:hypothetical protein
LPSRGIANERAGIQSFLTPKAAKTTVNDLLDELEQDYRIGFSRSGRSACAETSAPAVSRTPEWQRYSMGSWLARRGQATKKHWPRLVQHSPDLAVEIAAEKSRKSCEFYGV